MGSDVVPIDLGSAIWFARDARQPVYCHPREVGHARRDYLYSPRGNTRGAVSGTRSRRVSVWIIAHELVIAGEHVG